MTYADTYRHDFGGFTTGANTAYATLVLHLCHSRLVPKLLLPVPPQNSNVTVASPNEMILISVAGIAIYASASASAASSHI